MTGRLVVKGEKYYVVISYKDDSGKYKNKWISTGLDEKNNKRAATDLMREIVSRFESGKSGTVIRQTEEERDNPLFSDYLEEWLKTAKQNIQLTTYGNYKRRVKVLADYFGKKQLRLKDIKPKDIQEYYNYLQEQGKTVQECHHYHTIIHRALQVAYRGDYIQTNPADKVERPKSPKYKAKFYTAEQLRELFEKLKGDPYEFIYKMTAIYGFRRSEIIGLRWSSIDLNKETITLDHAVVQCEIDGKRRVVSKDKMKNQSSMRTLPVLPVVKQMLISLKNEQEERRQKYGRYYNNEYNDYVTVTEIGDLVRPDTLTTHFKTFLVRNHLPVIRLHDLRHSCASILIAGGTSMKAVQEWLGHSTFSTTADIYSHLNYSSKLGIADTLTSILESKSRAADTKTEEVSSAMRKIFRSTETDIAEEGQCDLVKTGVFESWDEEVEENNAAEEEPSKEREETADSLDDTDDISRDLDDEAESIRQYKKAKEEMKRLGLNNLDEYFEYLDFTERRRLK